MKRFPSCRLSRRQFFAAAMAGGGVLGYTCLIEPHWVKIVRRDMPIGHLPDALVDRTLVQISDLHVGPVVDDDYMRGALRQACALQPDILVITGDFMTSHADENVDQVARVLQEGLKPAPPAALAILGNHDYGPDWSMPRVADRLCARMQDLGITMLRNARQDVHGLQVIGLDDLWSPAWAPEAILRTIDPQQANLVLCHNPDGVDLPVWAGYRGWILAGHTHGGQCKPPFLEPPLLPVKNERYAAGEIDLFDGRTLYVNVGLGYLRKTRFNVRPEITCFTLRREETTRAGRS